MKLLLIYISTLFFSISTFSNELFKIQLNKEEKLEGTYSAEFISNKTIHVALIKNTETGKFLFSPYLVDENNKVLKLESFTMVKKLQILSYHLNGDVATFLNYDEEEKLLYVVDYDLTTGKSKNSSVKFKEKADNIFRFTDKTTFVFFDKKVGVSFTTIVNSENKIETNIDVPSEKNKVFKAAINKMPEAINQNEYVKNGSIGRAKTYLMNDKFFMTFENDSKTMDVFQFDLNAKSFHSSSFETTGSESLKDFGNYVFENKIGTIGIEKEDAILSFYDIENVKLLSKLSLSTVLDKPVLTSFIKLATRSVYKPTLTVNKNVNGKFVLRLDNVNEDTYTYNYNWWFHYWFFQQQMWHHQQMMMQQQMRFSPGGFGPNPMELENELYFFKSDSKFVEIVLDTDLKTVLNETKETVFKNIDKGYYVDKYKENGLIKEFSSAFTATDFRYIYQDKKSKTVTIFSDKM